MPYIGKKPENIIATAVDSTTGDFSGNVTTGGTHTVTGASILNGGIDVAGDFNFDVGGGDITLKDDGTSVANIGMESGSFIVNAPTSNTDIIFKGNDGGSAITALTLDMSAGGMAIFSGGVNLSSSAISFSGSISTPQTAAAIFRPADNVLAFSTANNERMRIDSSGNLLVGKTSADISVNGAELREGGFNAFVRDTTQSGEAVLLLNKKNYDGVIQFFQKDSTTVGSIGYVATGQYIQGETDHSGIRFGGNQLVPFRNGADTDATTDLGATSVRYRNLYLSGGVFLGGTGSANTLDDYEEGTWTPATSSSSYNTGSSTGVYTKIGRIVIAHFSINFSGVNSSANAIVGITNFPFTNGSAIASAGYVRESSNTGAIYVTRIGTGTTTATMNSMDNITNDSQRTIRTGEDYVGTLIYVT